MKPELKPITDPKPLPTKQPLHKRFIRALLFSFALLFLGSVAKTLYPSVKQLLNRSYSFTPTATATVAQTDPNMLDNEIPRPPDNVLLQTATNNRIVNTPYNINPLEKLSNKDRKELNRLLASMRDR